jgi:hypothetical protein
MKLRSPQNPIDMQACREVWRLQELGCDESPHVQAVMLYAVAKAIDRLVETMPRPEPDRLWQAFRAAIDCKAIRLIDLPLPLLSPGERFALALGTLFRADQLPTGETFLELVDSATGSGTGAAGMFALKSVLGLPTVQAIIPRDVLRFHGAKPARDYSDDEVMAKAREALDSYRLALA